ncbi:hypothetical protein [Parahaliea aestuarii]|uniref:Uncharacterized protein n=1 Tax=Parahaliea aestuarii TaxID=1852021 RepID=A0A5C8ZYF2_9GAMM|nr:hypothetical protein [Parahaliea aestuarii]TXS92632.1 hypothetical protein FVW59_09495 [Parahaliea aestuarii]
MRQALHRQRDTFSFARILVLAALLCAVAVPVVEASHMHGFGDGNAECLLCKSQSLAPLAAVTPDFALEDCRAIVAPHLDSACLAARYRPQLSRGPPHYA